MATIDVVDETYIHASHDVIAARLHDRRRWSQWWPDLDLAVFQDRGSKGIRWTISGALSGSMEVWLEPFRDGVIAHYYLRAEPATQAMTARQLARERDRRQRAARQIFWNLKDDVEATPEARGYRDGGK